MIALAALLLAFTPQTDGGAAPPQPPLTPCEQGDRDPMAWIAACQADIAQTAPDDTARLSSDYANLTFADINLALQTRGAFDTAIADATKGIGLDPNDDAAYLNRANAYSYAKDYTRSLADIAEVIRLNPKQGRSYALRCEIYVKQDRASDAIGECKLAIANDFAGGWTYLSLADAYAATGDTDDAIECYRRALHVRELHADDAMHAVAALKALGAEP